MSKEIGFEVRINQPYQETLRLIETALKDIRSIVETFF